MPLFSVVIPTVNRPLLLEQALMSLAQQTFREFEVIVVNDGGACVSDTIRKWSDVLSIRYVVHPQNRGVSAARNSALNISESPFVAFLDDDDLFLPQHMQLAYEGLSAGADLFYSGAAVCTARTSLPGGPVNSGPGYAYFSYPPLDGFMAVMNYIPTSAATVRTCACRFDESIAVLEDWRFWLDLIYKAHYVPVFSGVISVLYHRIATGNNVTSDTASAPRWTDTYERIWRQLPSTHGLVSSYRRRVRDFLISVEESVGAMDPIDHFRYEKCLYKLHNEYGRELTEGCDVELREGETADY
jgi:glycosyltransferase involved in cell wall biosynthesis